MKEYICLMEVHKDIDQKIVVNVINSFKGKIYQRPPVRSSVKRRLRIKNVNNIEIIDIQGRWYLLKITAEPGTYMRKLCHDIGLLLGVGAHMRELRRIKTGIFDETKNLITLHELSEAIYLWKKCKDETELRRILIPMELAACSMPKIIVDDLTVNSITYGAQLNVPGIIAFQQFKANEDVAILTMKGELVAVGKALVDSSKILELNKGAVVVPKRVIMARDIYPKGW
jgi:H/ACA ribonucleoprotein complex subunit 4